MCIFCKIINKEIPGYCIYEDEDVLAFLDISQVTKGHTLVVAKNHYDNFLDCDAVVMQHVMEVAQLLGKRILARTNAKGMNVLTNIHEIAGQSVMHFHVHLIPRYNEQDACDIHFHKSAQQNMDELLQLLK